MKLVDKFSMCLYIAICICNISLCAQGVKEKFDEKSAKSICERVADWQLANPNQLKEHGSTEWTQGALYTGIMSLYKTTGNKRYLNAMLEMGKQNNWKPGPRTYFTTPLFFRTCDIVELNELNIFV